MIRKVEYKDIKDLSILATAIVREHFDPIIGKAQNDYMLARFQSEEAIKQQLDDGYQYYFVMYENQYAGFLAFYPRDYKMYLSKFYVHKDYRGHHLASKMMNFVCDKTKEAGLDTIFLNVNKHNDDVISIYKHLGFNIVRSEENDIGNGFIMDDYVLEKYL